VKSNPKGPLADNIDLYLDHKRSLGKRLARHFVWAIAHLSNCAIRVASLSRILYTESSEAGY